MHLYCASFFRNILTPNFIYSIIEWVNRVDFTNPAGKPIYPKPFLTILTPIFCYSIIEWVNRVDFTNPAG